MKKRKFDFYEDENGCFICTSHKARKEKSYPKSYHKNKTQTVARHIYEACFGEVPKGKLVRHKCDNYKCINPEHLELGTPKDNMVDMSKRNRNFRAHGEKNGRAKLTIEQVEEIRKLKGKEASEKVGKVYGVAGRTVRDIWTGKGWQYESAI